MRTFAPAIWLVFLGGLYLALRARTGDWRTAFQRAALIFGVLLVVATEALSAIHALSAGPVITTWVVAAAVAGFLAIRSARVPGALRPGRWELRWYETVAVLAVAAIILAELAVAVVAQPNTWDSMAYHLPKVAHWIQQSSAAHYPGGTDAQLAFAPFAEYSVLHLQLLSGTDASSNLAQWGAGVGCCVSASLLARQLGADNLRQIAAALFAVTIPMVALQATSTQTDLITAYWLTSAASLVLTAVSSRPPREQQLLPALEIGAAVALAIGTKSTALLFLAPFGLWLVAASYRRGVRTAVRVLLPTLVVVVALNAPWMSRNVATYGRPLGPAALSESVSNPAPWPGVALNLMRNTARQLAVPHAPTNSVTLAAVERTQSALRLPDDPRTIFGTSRFNIRYRQDEDNAGSPLHVAMLLLSLLVLAATLRRTPGLNRGFALCAVSGYVIFCAQLRWQPWGERLDMPLLVLSAPIVATVLFGSLRKALTFAVFAALLSSTTYLTLLHGSPRPMAGRHSVFRYTRDEVMYLKSSTASSHYAGAADLIRARGARRVAKAIPGFAWEYPLWYELGAPWSGIEISDVTADVPFDALFCSRRDVCEAHAPSGWELHAFGELAVAMPRDRTT